MNRYIIMFKNYPDIIQALIAEAEADRLRYLDVFEKIDKTMQFFSVYVYTERLEKDKFQNMVKSQLM